MRGHSQFYICTDVLGVRMRKTMEARTGFQLVFIDILLNFYLELGVDSFRSLSSCRVAGL